MSTRTARLRTPADIGLALREARLSLGMTQAELAAELELPQSTVSELEAGKATIHIRRILGIAQLLDMSLTATWEDPDASRS